MDKILKRRTYINLTFTLFLEATFFISFKDFPIFDPANSESNPIASTLPLPTSTGEWTVWKHSFLLNSDLTEFKEKKFFAE